MARREKEAKTAQLLGLQPGEVRESLASGTLKSCQKQVDPFQMWGLGKLALCLTVKTDSEALVICLLFMSTSQAILQGPTEQPSTPVSAQQAGAQRA